jgi:hypothetical protein
MFDPIYVHELSYLNAKENIARQRREMLREMFEGRVCWWSILAILALPFAASTLMV